MNKCISRLTFLSYWIQSFGPMINTFIWLYNVCQISKNGKPEHTLKSQFVLLTKPFRTNNKSVLFTKDKDKWFIIKLILRENC